MQPMMAMKVIVVHVVLVPDRVVARVVHDPILRALLAQERVVAAPGVATVVVAAAVAVAAAVEVVAHRVHEAVPAHQVANRINLGHAHAVVQQHLAVRVVVAHHVHEAVPAHQAANRINLGHEVDHAVDQLPAGPAAAVIPNKYYIHAPNILE